MSATPGMDELRRLNDLLRQLLEDPHPGLMTWRQAVAKTCGEIGEYETI